MSHKFRLVIAGLMFSALMVPNAYAIGNPSVLVASNFGGRILATIPCTCTFNLKLILSPAAPALPAEVIFQPGISILYRYGMLVPTAWVLGRTIGSSTCWVGLIPFCIPLPSVEGGILSPMIHMVGTSLPGP